MIKRTKTWIKYIAVSVVTILLILIAVFLIGRYGWKLGGFNACEGAGIEKIEVTENHVHIEGFDPGSFPEGFIGYYAEQDGDKLYVGFRFSALFGWFESGDFSLDIPVGGEINEIIVKTKDNEYTVWPMEEKE